MKVCGAGAAAPPALLLTATAVFAATDYWLRWAVTRRKLLRY